MGGEKFKKIKYLLDNRLRDGVFGLIKFLLLIVILFILIAVVFVCKVFKYYDINEAVFRAMPTIINGWLPTFGEVGAENQISLLIIFTIMALFGVFFVSIFTGLITSSITQWLMNIKDNSTEVYENNHIIILGFNTNIYALINEIIIGNENKKICIVIASKESCDDMKNLLYSNIKITRNIRVVFRTIDICNVEDLKKLSIKTSKRVIINLTSNFATLQILLSLNNLYKLDNIVNVKTFALVYRDKHDFIKCIDNKDFVILELNKLITKLIARASNGHEIASIYKDVFNFGGCELYAEKIDYFVGKKYIDVVNEISEAIPVGLISNYKKVINPNNDIVICDGDKIVLLEEKENAYKIVNEKIKIKNNDIKILVEEKKKVCSIIGENETMELLKKEFGACFVECKYYKDKVAVFNNDDVINKIATESNSIVILNNHEAKDKEKEDAYNIFIMKKFENYRKKNNLEYYITLEISENVNNWHTEKESGVDFIIASDLHSQLLAQVSEKEELIDIFNELLSADGCEFNEISVSFNESLRKYKVKDIRNMLYQAGYIFVGKYDKNINKTIYMTDLNEEIDIINNTLFVVVSH